MRLSAAVLALLSLVLGACSGGVSSRAQAAPSADSLQSSGGSGGVAPSADPQVAFVAPEIPHLRQQRIFSIRDSSGSFARFLETLWADGTGNFALLLDAVQEPGAAGFDTPSDEWAANYLRRQRFLVHFREPHFASAERVRRNYAWRTLPGTTTVAGRDATTHRATNRHGYGSLELVLDQATDLLLGWTVRDEQGQILSSLETVEFALDPIIPPDLAWSEPAVPELPYRGPIDDPILGFSPLSVRYAPAGFFSVEQRIILAEQLYGSLFPNLHLEVLGDGLQVILVAQQGTSAASIGGLLKKHLLLVEDHGGVRVVEGPIQRHHVYVVGTAPAIELRAVWTSAGS